MAEINDYYDFGGFVPSSIPVGSTENKLISASWSPTNYPINYVLNGGINNLLNPSSYTIEDSDVVFEDPTRDGFNFTGWSVSSILTGSTGEVTTEASWEAIPVEPHTVTISTTGNGSVSPNGAQTVVDGGNLAITATPLSGNQFIRWIGSGVTITSLTSQSTTITNVLSDGSAIAVFEAIVIPPVVVSGKYPKEKAYIQYRDATIDINLPSIEMALDIATDRLSENVFGKNYYEARALFALHRYELNRTNSQNGSSQSGVISSEKEGDLQRSYHNNSSKKSNSDFLRTGYGVELEELSKERVCGLTFFNSRM